MQSDILLQIFNSHLVKDTQPEQSHQELIFDVVADYIFHLMNTGNIPQHFLDFVEEDLKDEVIEIYRKTTYGTLSLKEFRLTKGILKD